MFVRAPSWIIFLICSKVLFAIQLLILSLEEHYKYYEKQGLNKKEIIKKIAKDRNVNKNEIYMKFI